MYVIICLFGVGFFPVRKLFVPSLLRKCGCPYFPLQWLRYLCLRAMIPLTVAFVYFHIQDPDQHPEDSFEPRCRVPIGKVIGDDDFIASSALLISLIALFASHGSWLIDTWRYSKYLKRCELRWVTVRALQGWAEDSGGKIKRYQDLNEDEYMCLRRCPAASRGRCDKVINMCLEIWTCWRLVYVGTCTWWTSKMFVVSHPWLAPYHPDEGRDQLLELIAQLDNVRARSWDLVFIDFCGVPQKGPLGQPRNVEDEVKFDKCLKGMDWVYSYWGSRVLILAARTMQNTSKEVGVFSSSHYHHSSGRCATQAIPRSRN